MSLRLHQKHALLTGAAGGIGLAVVAAFVQQGARCTVADIGSEASPDLAKLMAAHPQQVQYIPTDVTRMPQITALVEAAAKRFGPITTLFNNAAVFDMAPLLESDEPMYDKLFAVNVKGAFFVMQQTNMASQAGRRGEALVSHYCASKAAVISYTQSAALAMAPHLIRVNAISPGVINTPMWAGVDALFAKYENLPIGEKKQQVGRAVPLGYMGEPADICGAAVFLASDESSYITAQTLNVDGGNVLG